MAALTTNNSEKQGDDEIVGEFIPKDINAPRAKIIVRDRVTYLKYSDGTIVKRESVDDDGYAKASHDWVISTRRDNKEAIVCRCYGYEVEVDENIPVKELQMLAKEQAWKDGCKLPYNKHEREIKQKRFGNRSLTGKINKNKKVAYEQFYFEQSWNN
jgi:hypothetical protein